jgi:type I restriction enzyme S subunit
MNAAYKSNDSNEKWFGAIPDNWESNTIARIFIPRNDKVSDKDFQPLSVTKSGIKLQIAGVAKTDNNDQRKLVKVGDYVINSRSDRKGSSGFSSLEGSVSLINIVFYPRQRFDINMEYFHFLFRSYYFCEEFYRNGTGIVDDLWSTNWEKMKKILIPVPSIEIQNRISIYLKKKVNGIEELIEKKQKFLALLQEKRHVLMNEAVTKGLDRGAVMKESGIEWLGNIPAHWSIDKIGRAFKVDMGKMNQSEKKSHVDSYIRYLKSINTQWFDCDFGSEQYMWCNPRELNKVIVELGDLLVCEGGEVGRACFIEKLPEDMIIEKSLHRVRSTKTAENKFLLYLLKIIAFSGWFEVLCNKSTIPHLTGEKLKELKIPLPPILEQKQIIAYLDSTMKKTDELTNEISIQIEKLQEYRQSLIYEAVTGKIDIHSYGKEVNR